MRQKSEDSKSKKRQIRGFSYEQVKAPATGQSSKKQASDTVQSPPPDRKRSSEQNSFEVDEGRNSQSGRVTPAWLRDPEPLPYWTPQQQRVLINQLDENPSSRKHPEHLRRAIEKTHRQIPEKSIEEIEQCYHHLQLKRIAYFGKEDGRQGPATGKTYRNPL